MMAEASHARIAGGCFLIEIKAEDSRFTSNDLLVYLLRLIDVS